MEINSFFLDLVPYLIPLLMIGVGTDLDIESFKNLITNSKSSIIGLLIQKQVNFINLSIFFEYISANPNDEIDHLIASAGLHLGRRRLA